MLKKRYGIVEPSTPFEPRGEAATQDAALQTARVVVTEQAAAVPEIDTLVSSVRSVQGEVRAERELFILDQAPLIEQARQTARAYHAVQQRHQVDMEKLLAIGPWFDPLQGQSTALHHQLDAALEQWKTSCGVVSSLDGVEQEINSMAMTPPSERAGRLSSLQQRVKAADGGGEALEKHAQSIYHIVRQLAGGLGTPT